MVLLLLLLLLLTATAPSARPVSRLRKLSKIDGCHPGARCPNAVPPLGPRGCDKGAV